MLTLPCTINCPRFTFEGLDTKKTDSFLLSLGVSYFHRKPYAHDPQELHQLPIVTAKFMKQPTTQSKEHYNNPVHSKLLTFDVLVDFNSFLFNFIPINIHTFNLLSLTAMITSTVVYKEDIQKNHLSQTQKCYVVKAILYQTECKTQFTDHLSIKVNNKQKSSCMLEPKYVTQKPVKQGMTVLNCEQLRRDKIPTNTPNSIVTIDMKAMRQQLVLT